MAWTTSFGSTSICYGCFIAAVVRATQALVAYLRNEAAEEGNCVLAILLRIIDCVIACAGDIYEWAYIQCAVTALGFCDPCWATFAEIIRAPSLDSIIEARLIDQVPLLGALMVGASWCIILLRSHVVVGGYNTTVLPSAFTLVFSALKSGPFTIFACFAQESDLLFRQALALYEAVVKAQIAEDEGFFVLRSRISSKSDPKPGR